MEITQFLADKKTREIVEKIELAIKYAPEGNIIYVNGLTETQKGAVQCYFQACKTSNLLIPSTLMHGPISQIVECLLGAELEGGDERMNIFFEPWSGDHDLYSTFNAFISDLMHGTIYFPKVTKNIVTIFPPRIIFLSCENFLRSFIFSGNIFEINCAKPPKKIEGAEEREKFDVDKMCAYGYEVDDEFVYGFTDGSGNIIFRESGENATHRVQCTFDKILHVGSDHISVDVVM